MRTPEETQFDLITLRIEIIRRSNNTLWMNLLRLAFRHAPDDARRIMKEITENDREISEWTSRL